MSKIYNPIAIYNYNNKKYFIAEDNNQIVYFKYENNEVQNNYSKDELEVFLKVFNSIKIDKEHVTRLGVKKVNNKFFEFNYDTNNNLYYWYEIIDGNRHTVKKEDLEFLNYKYNNDNLIYSSDEIYDWEKDDKFKAEENNVAQKTIKRGILHKGKTIAVVLVSGISLISLSDMVLHTNIMKQIGTQIGVHVGTDENNDNQIIAMPYDFKYIEEAIKSNPNITQEEKDFMLNLQFYFDSNGPYLNMKSLTERFKNLKIIYDENECESPQTMGQYNRIENKITIYRASSFSDCNLMNLLHEIMHATQLNGSNRLTMELFNELAARECARKLYDEKMIDESRINVNVYGIKSYGSGYGKCMNVCYLLADLIGDIDTIKRYQNAPNDYILVDKLSKIEALENNGDVTEEMKIRAVNLLDEIDTLRYRTEDGKDTHIQYTDEKYEKIRDMLDYYYKIKFNQSIDQRMDCFINEYDETMGKLDTSTTKVQALFDVMRDYMEENVENLDPKYKIPMGEYRYVTPRSYIIGNHMYPTLYFNSYKKYSNNRGEGFFMEVEINPELQDKYEKQYNKINNIKNNLQEENLQEIKAEKENSQKIKVKEEVSQEIKVEKENSKKINSEDEYDRD